MVLTGRFTPSLNSSRLHMFCGTVIIEQTNILTSISVFPELVQIDCVIVCARKWHRTPSTRTKATQPSVVVKIR
jgi:hypothetical protein